MTPSLGTRETRQRAWEYKFLVTPAIGEQIRDWARARLAPDPHGSGEWRDMYQVTSLYLDTPAFDVYHRNGSYRRGRFRIRRYGASPDVFLERKLRTKRLVAKRRTATTLDELDRLEEPHPHTGGDGRWFHRRLLNRHLSPVCLISYRRTARVAMTPNGPHRLTLDDDLRALPTGSFRFRTDPGMPILPARQVVELKFQQALPLLFKNLIEEFALNLQPFSKYRRAAASLGLIAAPATNTEPSLVCPHA